MNIELSFILFIHLLVLVLSDPQAQPSEQCGKHEVFAVCGAPCPETCEFLNLQCPGQCQPGGACVCLNGYVRDNRGKCVRAERYCNETSKCGHNEEFSSCGPLCEPQCNIKFKCREGCASKCVCLKGFIRNSELKCIREDKCPPPPTPPAESNSTDPEISCVGKHKVFNQCGLPAECTPSCDNPQPERNGDFCATVCVKGCFCDEGYVSDQFGECIPKENCPNINPIVCSEKPHEVFKSCGQLDECIPTCDDPKLNKPCPALCKQGCYCKDGYLRNSLGICVKKKNCPNSCTGVNEIYLSCGTPLGCTPTCDNRLIDTQCLAVCTKGCYCKDGYLKNSSGVCVLEKECPVNTCSGNNEIYKTCGSPLACTPTCDDRKTNVRCANICTKGCYCEDGYLRDKSGKCVLEPDCPIDTCKGSNEIYKTCGSPLACTPTCDNRKIIVRCNICAKGCFCEDGYLRDASGKCVLEQNCPQNNTCLGDHQIYAACGKLASCLPTCEKPNNTQTICPDICVPGCFCKKGYLINKDKKCIRSSKCPPASGSTKCDDPLKQYNSCGTPAVCTATCEKPVNNKLCPALCMPGCFCKDGYLINKNGECIKSSACPPNGNQTKCDDPLKEYNSCGKPTGCTATCEKPINNKLCINQCNPGCFCKEGYLMNKDGKCILSNDCPPGGENLTCIDPLKKYTTCGKPSGCTPTCEIPLNNRFCPAVCIAGCICKDGYLENESGQCIESSECPPIGGNTTCDDPLKLYDPCGKPAGCTPTCEKPINNKFCINVCNPGCFCKEGYLLNKDNKCIQIEKCSPKIDPSTCVGSHKIFSKCGLANICLPTCENPHNTRPCPKKCTEGCFCGKGYLINAKGKCVRENKCPPQKQCSGDFKYYDSCGKPPGFYPTCENPINEKTCPGGCVEGCYCEEGYLMNKLGDCIEATKCLGNIEGQ